MASTTSAADFTVGWICALPIELAAAGEMLDEEYDQMIQPPTDTNIYTFGRVGLHKVVVACLPAGQMGTTSAAAVASQMRNSFPGLRFGLLVGIGGGVPSVDNDIRLGDVVISQPVGQHGGVVQFDMGKTGLDGRVARTGNLNAPPAILLNALAKLRANYIRGRTAISKHLTTENTEFANPGPQEDALYIASSQHITDVNCAKCNLADLVKRTSRTSQHPALFFGNIASGNQVMKDGPTRDRISQELGGILCFEMEAAGLMNNLPCLVIRGICDYADAHKNKRWQPYAAATAAACAKELLNIVPVAVPLLEHTTSKKPDFVVPIGRNVDFIGREYIIEQLMQKVSPDANKDDCQRLAIEGLGGIGKTQIALEIAYRIRNTQPNCSVFWVPAVNMALFESGCRTICQTLGLPGVDDNKADVKSLMKMALEKLANNWILIVDNADDVDLLMGKSGGVSLNDLFPFNHKGSILFTTRSHEVASQLVPVRHIVVLTEMSQVEATGMLQKSLDDSQMRDEPATETLLDLLAYLPLAVKQASSYMSQTGITVTKYLEYYRSSDKYQTKLLSRDFDDRGRYRQISNPIATTWLISFQHIAKRYPIAAEFLRLICFFAEKEIPKSLLPQVTDEMEKDEAIGVLKGYAFIIEREDSDSFDMHRLVRLVTRNWLKQENTRHHITAIQHIHGLFPWPQHNNRSLWLRYMPHALAVLENDNELAEEDAYVNLLHSVAWSYYVMGRYEEAEFISRKALKIHEEKIGEKHPETLRIMNSLAIVLSSLGRYKDAEVINRKLLALSNQLLGPKHSLTLVTMNNLASLLRDMGRFKESGIMHREILEMRKEILGEEDRYSLSSMTNVANVLVEEGEYEKAELMHRQTLDLKTKLLGREDADTADSINNLAELLRVEGKYEEAEKLYREDIELCMKTRGPEHPDTLESMSGLAVVLDCKGRFEEAELLHRKSLKLKEKVIGLEHPDTLYSMSKMADLLRHQGHLSGSQQLQERALRGYKIVLGAEHPRTLESMSSLAAVLESQKNYTEAESVFNEALRLRKKVLGEKHPSTLATIECLDALLRSRQARVSSPCTQQE